MPTKLIKILQRESGPFTTSNNLCSIDLDPNNVTDLSASYLNMEVTFKNPDGSVPDGRVRLGHLVSGAEYDTSCFIRHATLRADSVGLVEQQRFCNVNSQTMKQYEMSSEEARSERIFNSEIVTVDANGTAHLIVPLPKILGCASAEEMYPDYRFGQSRLELEFEQLPVAYKEDPIPQPNIGIQFVDIAGGDDGQDVNEFVSAQNFADLQAALLYFVAGRTYSLNYIIDGDETTTDVLVTGVTIVNNKAVVMIDAADAVTIPADENMSNISLTYDSEPAEILIEDFTNATGAVEAYDTITVGVTNNYKLHVGREYLVGYLMQSTVLVATDPYSYSYGKLKSATVDPADDSIYTLVFDRNVVSLNPDTTCTEGFIFLPGEVGPCTWEISKVDLVLAKPLKAMQVPVFEFQTNLVELVNLPGGVREFRRQVELEQNVDLVTMMNPISCLIGEKQFYSFRNSVNSVDTITKDVVIAPDVNGSIYFDKLMQSFDMLKKVQPYNGTLEVAVVPERIMPEQAILPNNVVEFRLQKADGAVTDASILYFFKRLTKAM